MIELVALCETEGVFEFSFGVIYLRGLRGKTPDRRQRDKLEVKAGEAI